MAEKNNKSIDIDQETILKLRGKEQIPIFAQTCRVCLCPTTNESDQQLKTRIQGLNKVYEIRSLLEESTGVQIVDLEFLPNHICDKCFQTLKAWYKLRSQTQRSNGILKKYLRELESSLDKTSFANTDLTIHMQGEKLNVVPTQNVYQIQDFQVSVVKDKPEVVGFVLHCDSCSMTYTNQMDLEKHQEEHIKPPKQESFKCQHCSKSFDSHIGLSNHMKYPHYIGNSYKYQCDGCEKTYSSLIGLKVHKSKSCIPFDFIKQCKTRILDVRKEDLIAATEKTIKETKISCILCKKNFKVQNDFIAHYSEHDKDRKCHICHKDFALVKYLEQHVRRHLRAKIYACPRCSRSFYTCRLFRSHMQDHGTNDWVYRCKKCQKEFFRLKEFKMHILKHFKCMKDKNKTFEKVKHNVVADTVEMDSFVIFEIDSESEPNTLSLDDSKNESTDKIKIDISSSQEPFQQIKTEVDAESNILNQPEKDKSINMEVDSMQQIQFVESPSLPHSSSQLEANITVDHENSNQVFHTNATEVSVFKDIVKLETPILVNSSSENKDDDETDDTSTLSKSNDQISENQSAYRQEPLDKYKVNCHIPGSEKKCSNLTEIWKELLDRCMVNCHIPGCQKKCSSFNKIWKHFEKKHLSGKNPYKCSMCFEEFNTETPFRLHIEKYYLFQCPVCSKFEPNSFELKRHVITHSFECPKCLKKFASFQYLKAHEITHTDEKQSNESKQQLQVIKVESPSPENSSSQLKSDTQRDQEHACESQSIENNPSNTNATESKWEISVRKDIVKLESPSPEHSSSQLESDTQRDQEHAFKSQSIENNPSITNDTELKSEISFGKDIVKLESPSPEHSSSQLESVTQRDQEHACKSQSIENNPSITNDTELKSEISFGKDIVKLESPSPEHSSSQLESVTQRDQEHACKSQSIENNPSITNATELKSEISVGKDIVKLEITSDEEDADKFFDEIDDDTKSTLSKSNDQITNNLSHKPDKNASIQMEMDFSIDIMDSEEQLRLRKTKIQSVDSNPSYTDNADVKALIDILMLEDHTSNNSSEIEENIDEIDAIKSNLSQPNDQICTNQSAYNQELLDKCKLNCYYAGCQTKCSNLAEIWKHISTFHLCKEKNPNKCSTCLEQFAHMKAYKDHIQNHYTFQCPVCPKIKANVSQLKRHVIQSHSYERPFQCSKCTKKFASNFNLKAHEVVHNSERNFVCKVCSKNFFCHSSLYQHIKKIHKNSNECDSNT